MRRISSAFLIPQHILASYSNLFLFFNVWSTFWHALLITTNIRESGDEKVGRRVNIFAGATSVMAKDIQLLNVSYDPTRNCTNSTTRHSAPTGNSKLAIRGDSSVTRWFRQTSDVGNQRIEADVVTLALAYDVDAIAEAGGLIKSGSNVCRITPHRTLHHCFPGT